MNEGVMGCDEKSANLWVLTEPSLGTVVYCRQHFVTRAYDRGHRRIVTKKENIKMPKVLKPASLAKLMNRLNKEPIIHEA